MFKYSEIKTVHLEVTSKCNASCPMCARNLQGGLLNPQLKISELKLTDIQEMFEEPFLKQLNKIYFCGNYGDPAMAQDCLEIVKHFRKVNPQMIIGIHTNGGMRDEAWWAELAPLLTYCRFGIDGLEDTNHLYRQGVRWPKLMKNVKSFIDNGGYAEWDFLLFKHNQHQVDEVKALSKKLGFKKIQIKSTSRFFNSRTGEIQTSHQVKGPTGENSHFIEPHELAYYSNNMLDIEYNEIIKKYETVQNYWDKALIDCKTAQEKSIYISFDGQVFPCCWTANQVYTQNKNQVNSILTLLESEKLELSSLSLKQNGLSNILEGNFFQKAFKKSWKCSSVENGKLQVCSKTCGQKMKPFESQFVEA